MSVLEARPYKRTTAAPATTTRRSCSRPSIVQRLVFSHSRYPNIRRHYLRATRVGWPRTLVVNRPGTDERRDRLLEETSRRRTRDLIATNTRRRSGGAAAVVA